ncbi:MAG: CHAT domain-containing protein, partial [Planctomycetales bacterium]|nr:CHAT domain-containing protein [Planctomycetales bacterium]
VPLQMCELDEVPTRYAVSEHVDLLKHKEIAKAVIDLLRTGETERLHERPEVSRKHGEWIEPKAFRTAVESRRAWTADAIAPEMQASLATSALAFSSTPLEPLERQAAPLAEPIFGEQAAFLDDVRLTETFVNRDRQSQIDLELYHGSLFDVPYRAVVLGIFEDVDPTGPADKLNELSGGAIRELIERRMFDGGAGHVFVAPTGRNLLRCDYIVFMGLGRYADFIESTDAVIRLATSNTLRTLLHCGVDELATLVVGGGSGQSIRNAVRSMVCGFLEAIQEMKGTPQATVFRRLGLCEFDAKRYAELKSEVVRFAFTQDATELRFRLHEADYPATESRSKDRKADREDSGEADSDKAAKSDKVDINYLTVRMDGEPGETGLWQLYASLLTSGKGAAVYPSVKTVEPATLDQLTQELAHARLADVPALSERLSQLLFSAGFRELLENTNMESTHLAVVHNALASRVPWEALRLGQKEFPCLEGGVSRRHEADGADSVAKHLRQRQIERTLNILLVVDPTEDLPGARREGDALQRIIGSVPQATLTTLTGEDATRRALLDRLGSGEYDVLHYAGHAFFDPLNRRRSGLICHDETLVSADIEQLERLPALVFFNACESGRVRKRGQEATAAERRQQNVGIAEALLAGGVTQFVGTYWPVGDDPAFAFASKFYQALTSGRPVYEAVLKGRTAVHESGSTDFANYLHYGSPRFRVKHSS